MKLTLIGIFLLSVQYGVFAYYSSTENLHKLLETEISRIQLLEKFIKALEQRNEYIKKFISTVELNVKLIAADRLNFFGNPIGAYKTIRKFSVDWTHMSHLITNSMEVEEFQRNLHNLPMQSDKLSQIQLHAAVEEILQLQQEFGLTTSEIADGTPWGVANTAKLSVNDCYHLGRVAYELRKYRQAVSWFHEANTRFEFLLLHAENQLVETPDLEILHGILEYLARSMNKLGNYKMVERHVEILLLVQPDNKFALEFKATYKRVKPIAFDATIA